MCRRRCNGWNRAVEGMKASTNADTAARPADNEDTATDEDKDLHRSPPIQLETRAVPLLSLLKRAAAAKADGDCGKAEHV